MQNNFRSQMADQICYAVLCVFSYVAAGQSGEQKSQLVATATQQDSRTLANI